MSTYGLPQNFRRAWLALQNLMHETQGFRAEVEDRGGRLSKTQAERWSKLLWDIRRRAENDIQPIYLDLKQASEGPVTGGGLTRSTVFELLLALDRRSEDAALLLMGVEGKKLPKKLAKVAGVTLSEAQEFLDGMKPIPRAVRDKLMSQLECEIWEAAFPKEQQSTSQGTKTTADDAKTVTAVNDPRDKWIYEQCCKLVVYDTIILKLKRRPGKWQHVTTVSGIKRAAQRYASRHGLPDIPKRQRGRPKN